MRYFIYGFLSTILVAFFSNTAFGATTRPVSVDPKSISAFLFTPNNLDGVILGRFETIATTPQNQQVTRYTSRSVPLSKARLGSLARSAVGGPASLAVTAAVVASGFLIDNDTGEIIEEVEPVDTVGEWWLSNSIFAGEQRYIPFASKSAIDSGIADYVNSIGRCYQSHSVVTNTSSVYTIAVVHRVANCTGLNATNNLTFQIQINENCPSGFSDYGDGTCQPDSVGSRRLPTDTEIGVGIANSGSPSEVTDILNDPISTGTWRDRWPEIEPVTQDIEDQLGHDIEGGPVPVNPDQTISDGSTFNPPETDTGSGGSISAEWPTFCGWAGVVCDFIDWVQEPFEEPEPVEVPYVEIDFEEDYDSGIGIPNCPAPIAIVTQFGTVEFDWSNTCSLADMIKPLVIAFSYLIGIYILLRVK